MSVTVDPRAGIECSEINNVGSNFHSEMNNTRDIRSRNDLTIGDTLVDSSSLNGSSILDSTPIIDDFETPNLSLDETQGSPSTHDSS